MSSLRIYFTDKWRDPTSPCEWALCDDSGTLLQTGHDPLANLPKGHECIAILAPDRVLSIASTLPPGLKRRSQAALPFIAEEYTLTEPDNNHVVPGKMLDDGRTALAVVDKTWLSRIIEACRNAKITLRRVIPETFMPPLEAGGWTMIWDGKSGFLRTGVTSGLALDSNDHAMPLGLQLQLRTATLPQKIMVSFPQSTSSHIPQGDNEGTMSATQQLPAWHNLSVPLVSGAAWDWRSASIPPEALNMLWGELAPSIRLKEWWPSMRPVALLLLALFLIEAIGTNIEWAMLTQERKTLTDSMQRSFRSAFGEGSALVNAPLQMQRNLAEIRHAAGLPDEGDFLPLINLAAVRLNELPAGSVRNLHYETGRLDVDIKLARNEDFHKLQSALQKSGLNVRMGELQNSGDSVQSRLTLMSGNTPFNGTFTGSKP
ncbi:MAG: type II secretion system protein GspL [Candidatus Nitrotoga sp.]